MQLVRETISADSVEAIQQILEGFIRGQYTGAGVGLIRPRRRFTVHCLGEACRNPTLARGLCLSIDDELSDLLHGGGEQDTVF